MKFVSRLMAGAAALAILLGLLAPTLTVQASALEQQAQFAQPTMIVNASFLNIRTGPDVRYSVLITVVGGTELPVLGRARDGVWFQVSTVVGVGWVNSQFVIPRGDFRNVPTVDFSFADLPTGGITAPSVVGLPDGQGGGAMPQSSMFQPGGNIVARAEDGSPIIISGPSERFRAFMVDSPVDLRSQPMQSAPAIGTVFPSFSKDYPIVGSSRDSSGIEWLAVIAPDIGTGWVEAPRIRTRLSAAFRTVMVVTATSVGMGDGPNSGSGTLPVLSEGREAYLVNVSQDGRAIQIELAGGEVGWIPFESAITRTGTTTDGLNLTAVVTPPAASDDAAFPPAAPPTRGLEGPRVIINTAFLNVRSGPGAQFTQVATVSGGSEFAVAAIASDRVWYLIEGNFGRGWINSEFVIFRGAMQNVPIIPLSSAVGVISTPTAIISGPVVLYAAPGVNFGAVGTLNGPLELNIVARTSDSAWMQLNTTLGFGWVLAEQVALRGDLTNIPIAAG